MTSFKPPPNPYIGPRAFTAAESDRFFGRDQEIQVLLGLVQARRATLQFAQSGAGKSTLVFAGLVPRLLRTETVGRGRRKRQKHKMDVLAASVGGTPAANAVVDNVFLFNALTSLRQITLEGTVAAPAGAESDGQLITELGRYVASDGELAQPVLLILDQFEEIFTQNSDRWSERTGFFEQLAAVQQAYPNLHLLFSMREDFIAELTPYLHLIHDELRSRYRMERLQEAAAFAAIQMPALSVDIPFDDDAVTELLADLRAKEQYIEPVQLQVACHNLWLKLEREEKLADGISKRDVQELGDVSAALANYYCNTVASIAATPALKVRERQIRDWIDTKLISPQGIRIQVLREPIDSGGLPTRVALQLEDAHLIRLESRRNAAFFELSHDRLVEPIRTDNVRWREENLNSVLQVQARLWHRAGQSPDLLLRDEELANAIRWSETNVEDLVEYERAFLDACLAQQERLEQQRLLQQKELEQAQAQARARQRLLGVMGLFLVVALALTVFSINARQDALDAQAVAEEQSALAATSQADAEAALLIAETSAAEAARQADRAATSAAEALRQADLAATRAAEAVAAEAEAVRQANLAATREAEAQAAQARAEESEALAESQRLAFAARDASNNRSLALLLAVEAVRATPSTRALAELNRVLQGDTGGFEALFDGDPDADEIGAISRVVYSPGGRWLLVMHEEAGLAQVWRVATREWITTIRHDSAITAFAFANAVDGTWLATGSESGELFLWQLPFSRAPDAPAVLNSSDTPLLTERFANGIANLTFVRQEEGYLLNVVDDALDAYPLWQVAALSQTPAAASITPAGNVAAGIAFTATTPDGQWVSLATSSGSVFLRQLTGERRLLTTGVEQGPLLGLSFDPTGRRLVTTGIDNSVQVWDVILQREAPVQLRYALQIDEMITVPPVFSGTGDLMALGTANGTVRLYDAANGTFVTAISQRHVDGVSALAFNPTRPLLASAAVSGDVFLWDTITFNLESSFGAHLADVNTLAFNASGSSLATGSDDTSVLLRPIESDNLALSGHRSSVYGLDIRPGEQAPILASSSGDGTVRLWSLGDTLGEAQSSGTFSPITAGDALFSLIDFLPTQDIFAFGNAEGQVELWQITDENSGRLTQLQVLTINLSGLYAVTFSPDGEWLAVGSNVGVVALWRVADVLAEGDIPPHLVIEAEETGDIYGLTFNYDSRYVVFTNGRIGDLVILDMGSGETLTSFNPHNGATVGLGTSPTENILVTADGSGQIFVWDLDALVAGELEPLATWPGTHQDMVISVRFAPDGSAFATGGLDGQLLLWNVDAAAQRTTDSGLYEQILAPEDTQAGTFAVAFSNDGRWLFAGLESGQILIQPVSDDAATSASQQIARLIESACAAAGRNMTYDEWSRYLPPASYRQTCAQFPVDLQSMLGSAVAAAESANFDTARAILDQARILSPDDEVVADTESSVREIAIQFYRNRAIDLALAGDVAGAEATLSASRAQGYTVAVDLEIVVTGAAIRAGVQNAIDAVDADLMAAEAERAVALGDTYLAYYVCSRGRAAGFDAVVTAACDAAAAGAGTLAGDDTTATGTVPAYGGDAWLFDGVADQVITIDMMATSTGFDTYLELVGPDGLVVTSDDDGGDGFNSRITEFRLAESGTYAILARGFGTSGGAYALTLREVDVSIEEEIEALISATYDAIDAGDLAGALALIEAAMALEGAADILDPFIATDPERFVLTTYFENGLAAAQSFAVAAAEAIFRDLVAEDPTLPLDPVTAANAPLIGALLGEQLSAVAAAEPDTGALTQAIALAQLTGDPRLLADVCLAGLELRLEDLVLPACAAAATAARPIALDSTVAGVIPVFGGETWTFSAQAGTTVTLELVCFETACQSRGNACDGVTCLDPYLMLIGPSNTLVAFDDDNLGDLNAAISGILLPSDGTYLIVARGYQATAGAYQLTLETVSP